MRVLHLLYEPKPSGISRHVLEVVRMLPELEHAVILPRGLGEAPARLAEAGARVFELPLRSRFLPRQTFTRLPWRIWREDPDVLHLHALETGVFGSLAGRLGRARGIAFTPQTFDMSKRYLLPLYRALMRRLGRRHAWGCVNRGQLAQVQRLVGSAQAFLVVNAVPQLAPLATRAEARERLGWPRDRPVLASVVRLSGQKDPLVFVRAARQLAAAHPDLLWVLAGDGPLQEACAREGRGLENLRLQGRVDGLEDVLAGSDFFCLASRWEGMSLSLLAALDQGLPTIASRIDGNVDLVRHQQTGLLVEPGDDAGLAAAAARLVEDSELAARLGEAGQAFVRDHHSPAAVRRQQLELYRSLG